MGIFTKDIKTMATCSCTRFRTLLRRKSNHQGAAEDDRQGDQPELKAGFKTHLEETKNQIARLDQVFQKLGKEPKGVDCPAIDGIIKESDETAGEIADKSVLDAALVTNAQLSSTTRSTVTARSSRGRKFLAMDDVVRLLTTNLNEEKGDEYQVDDACRSQGRERKGFGCVTRTACR